jgi:predicted transcriptional regulator
MFQKCFRGDAGDNVMSSYPRLRSDKIKKAYTDDYTLENILQHTFEVEYFDENGDLKKKNFKTIDLFNENMLLMDLYSQPDEIKELIRQTVKKTERSKYNMIEFMKFCNHAGLKNISENLSNFTGLLLGKK